MPCCTDYYIVAMTVVGMSNENFGGSWVLLFRLANSLHKSIFTFPFLESTPEGGVTEGASTAAKIVSP